MRRDVPIQSQVYDSRFDGRASVLDIERDDFLETVESEDYDVVRQRATGQPSSGATRNKRQPLFGQESNYRDRFLAGSGKNSQTRLSPVARQTIRVVDKQLALTTQYVVLAHNLAQTLRDH